MQTSSPGLMTTGQLGRREELSPWTEGQIMYTIRVHDIQPVMRAGILRLYSEEQIPLIVTALRRTARKEA